MNNFKYKQNKNTNRSLKILIFMKFFWTLCLITTIQAFATNGYTQSAMVNIHMENAKIENILKEIEKQSEYRFFYDANSIVLNDVADVTWNSTKVSDALSELFGQKGIAYRLIDKQIVLFPTSMLDVTAAAQGITITGTVTDIGGPLPGVNVVVKGTSYGSVTDVNGRYSINVPDENAVLQFTFVGYAPQDVVVGSRRVVDVEMTEDARQLEEVVVVGYGTQRRVNLTGSVDQVTSEIFENRPVSNVTQALVGAAANMNIQLRDGKPTGSPDINIRGTTSIGQGGSALVLIDGVEGDPRMLNPNDIESISVLKDAASASIYGARATFGVILITTKNPNKGKAKVTYSAILSLKSPTAVPDLYNESYPWAKGFNDAWTNWNDNGNNPTAINKTMAFSQDYLAEIKRRWENPDLPRYEVMPSGEYRYYYSTDWYKQLYKDRFFDHDHNISVSGGNDLASIYVSGRYNGNDGLFRYNSDTYDMYNFRVRGNIQVTKWLKLENNAEFSNMKYRQPYNVGEGSNIWRNMADEGFPLSPLTNPDGTITMSSAYTVGDMYLGKSFGLFQERVVKNKIAAVADFFDKSLTVNADYSFRFTDYGHEIIRTEVPYSRYEGVISYIGSNTNDYEKRHRVTQYQAANIYANYAKSFNEAHNFNLLVGFNYEQSVRDNIRAVRNGILFDDVSDINLTVGSSITTSGGYEKWRVAGSFFRVNYNFKERYLLEVNGRYDGSSKFPEYSQWAFFPSVSVGWRISQESFWNVDPKAISNLKIRASYGSLGNGSIGSYRFIETFSISRSARIINGSRPQRTAQPGVIPNSLTWETATIGNIGFDIEALNSRLSVMGDVYRRWTTDMYTIGETLPAVYGTTVPRGNYATLETTGFELSVSWRDRFNMAQKPFNYNVRVGLSDYVAKITKFIGNQDKNFGQYATEHYEGKRIGEMWGFRVEGLFRSAEDVANSPSQSNILAHNSRRNYPGDLKFKNLDGDDVIWRGSDRVDDPGDREIIGNSEPRFSFSFQIGADWNGFFFSSFFQGIMKQNWYPSAESQFWGQYNRPYNYYPRWQVGRQFSSELQNYDAYLPGISGYNAQNGNGQLRYINDRYLQNVGYIRLRSLNVGYTIPAKISNKIGASDLRVFVSGENLWSWSPLYKTTKDFDVTNLWGSGTDRVLATTDIGTSGDGFNYPTLKTISLGLSITF